MTKTDTSGTDYRPDAGPEAVPEAEAHPSLLGRLGNWIGNLPPFRRPREVLATYSRAGGSLLAEALAYSALFAGFTGLLFSVGILGYLVPAEADRQRVLDLFTGQLAPLAPVAKEALRSVATNAGAFSLIGLAGMAWGTSHFYGALDEAIARVFNRTPARAWFDRILRGFVSVLLLVGGLLSGIGFSAIKTVLSSGIEAGSGGDTWRTLAGVAFALVTAVAVTAAVAILYRVVPNTHVPVSVLGLPALVAGLVLAALTELLVYLAPLLTGALSLFGGVATIFVILAWLHLAFQVILIGAAWTRVRLDDRVAAGQP
jgi:membrane protein